MRSLISIAMLVTLVSAGSTEASTPNTGPKPWEQADGGVVPSDISRYAKCTVRRVEPPRRVTFYDHETRKLVTLDLDEEVELTARRKKDFDGRSRLVFADLRVGHVVKVRYRTDSGRVLGLRVVGTAR